MRIISASILITWLGMGFARAGDLPRKFHDPAGRVRTSWVGNSFGGDGGPNG